METVLTKNRTAAVAGALASCLVLVGCSGDGDAEGALSAAESSAGTTTPNSADAGGANDGNGEASVNAQESPTGANVSPPQSTPSVDPLEVDDGEPGKRDKKGRQTDVFERVPGANEAKCVGVGGGRDLRSGGFVGGPFDDAVASYGTERAGFAKREVRLYFVPLNAASMPGLKVDASGPDGAKAKVRRVTKADTEEWQFYDATIRLPQAGRWTFQVTAGPDRGCFVVDF